MTFEAANTDQDFLPTRRRIVRPKCRVADHVPIEHREIDEAIERRVGELSLDATALPIDDILFIRGAAGVRVSVRMLVPNRDKPETIEWIQIWRDLTVPWDALGTDPARAADVVVRTMREIASGILVHEFDENLLIDGERVLDPHRLLVVAKPGGAT